MKSYYNRIIAALLLSLMLPAAVRGADRRAAVIDSLRHSLESAASARDSLGILYDIFDLSVGENRRAAVRDVYDAAVSAGDTVAQIDAIKYQANLSFNAPMYLERLSELIEKYPDSPKAREVALFIRLLRFDNMLRDEEDDIDSETLGKLICDYTVSPPDSYFDRIDVLYRICSYLGSTSRGELYKYYTRQLERLVAESPLVDGSLRHLVYTRMAPVFTAHGMAGAAIRIDRNMLNIIDSLSTTYAESGRKYRTLSTNRYSCYSRLLANYDSLSRNEVEQYYRAVLDLAEDDNQVKANMDYNPVPQAYYNMAVGNYPEAVEYARRAIATGRNAKYHKKLYHVLYEAAAASGDRQTQFDAAVELYNFYTSKSEHITLERARENSIISVIGELRARSAELERMSRYKLLSAYRVVIGIVALALIALVIALVWQRRAIRRRDAEAAAMRTRLSKLTKENEELTEARKADAEQLEKVRADDKTKSDFVNSMCHEVKTPLAAISEYTRLIVDCIADAKRPYLDRFANIVDLNARLVQTIVNDVLDMASLEHGNMAIRLEPSSVHNMCLLALDNVFENEESYKPGIKVLFNTAKLPDVTVLTDSQRVVQVLINLLKNAEKFTDSGTITLDYKVEPDAGRIVFSVTDTGIGIPNGQEEAIFNRFRQLDINAGGCGLGLYISRLIATLLNAIVKVDTSYRKGARFLFILPL